MTYKIDCPTCKQRVNYVRLRIDRPKCEDGHPIGRWVMCQGQNGKHVFLSKDANDACPVCDDKSKVDVPLGTKVKCMKMYPNGQPCPTPEYSWFREGPPCNLNHIDVILVK